METNLVVAVEEALQSPMDRRNLIKMMAGAGALALTGLQSLPRRANAAQGEYYRTTDSLNLRKSASTSAQVLLVMPAGAMVQDLGEQSNNFKKIAYQGTSGWAHSGYLELTNGGSSDPPAYLGDAVTTTSVNFRTGPSNGHSVIQVLPKSTTVTYSDRVEYGYRFVKYNGRGGWVYDDYLTPAGGEGPVAFTTTAYVNMRKSPSTSAQVIVVVPAGETVLDYDLEVRNGWRGVDWKGKVGWIYGDYLK
jgi:uncharacterized protein YgiM (DUF1202 family)